mgnify:CR=1 FL=1
MKLATYNIYKSELAMPQRKKHIIETIKSVDADIIVLQEVTNASFFNELVSLLLYPYYHFTEHSKVVVDQEPDRKYEGLAIFSKFEISSVEALDYMMVCTIKHHHHNIALANVHLPWHSVLAQEKCVLNLNDQIMKPDAHYRFILGDFNCNEHSSTHHFLKGLRSLNNQEVKHYWTDLALVAQEFLATPLEVTIDLKHNPRWRNKTVMDNSARVDCIFMHDCFPKEYPSLQSFELFGKEVHENNFCSSDHYGVCATIRMPYEIHTSNI